MATSPNVDTLFEGSTIIVKHITVAVAETDGETVAETLIIDRSAIEGPDGQGNTSRETVGSLSLLEASWSLSSVWEGADLYWHDDADANQPILSMVGDSAISYRGIGGKHYPGAVAEEADGNVRLDLTNAEEAIGTVDITLVFKKKA